LRAAESGIALLVAASNPTVVSVIAAHDFQVVMLTTVYSPPQVCMSHTLSTIPPRRW
jgi:hypothetical protein